MKLIVFLFVIFSQTLFSQSITYSERNDNDTLPEKFIIDKDQLRNHIFSGIPYNIRTGEYSRRALNFANDNANDISDYISSGNIYRSWNELEGYINEILQKILPPELYKDSVIHVYIVKDGSYNASMTPSGHIFMNIGLIAESSDEASIAGVLSHELAHYYLKHSLHTFLEEEAGNFDRGIISTGNPRSKFSVKNESQADSLAAIWLQASGYNLDGLVSSFSTMYRLERNMLKKREQDWTLKETTHPVSQKRLGNLTDFYNQNKDHLGKSFLVSEAKFLQFKEEVKPEILKSLLNDFDYNDCIEKSFRFHLFDPDNKTYVYYLMEGIRRKAYLNVNVWKEMFITNMYYDSVMVDGHKHKEKMTDHLFKKFDLDIIPIDPKDGMKLKAKFYWRDQPKFTTYEEAYNFFYNLSQALNCHECLLSNALSYTKDTSARNKLLKNYLSFDDAKHKEFANDLLKGTLTKNLSKNKITAFNELDVQIEQGYERISVLDKKNLFKNTIDSIMKNQPNRVSIYLPEFKKNHVNDYLSLMALQEFSFQSIISKGEKTELHILDPRYWELFHKYNVSEMEFIVPEYYELRGKEKSIEAYQKIIDTDFSFILSKTSNNKTFELIIGCIREMDDALMKVRFYDKNELNSKESTSNQIAKLIRYELSIKDKKAIEQDQLYRYNSK